MNTKKLLRSLWMLLWFVLVPGCAAALIVSSRSAFEPNNALTRFVHDQPLPVGILVFTVLTMVVYSYRHHLPWAERINPSSRGLSADLRRDIEAAGHLLDESDRILAKHKAAVEQHLGAAERERLLSALDRLREELKKQPVDDGLFTEAYVRAGELSYQYLDRWKKSEFREYIESITIAILVALLLREVVIEAFKIPSGSMLPTLQIGDHIFVNKFKYGPTIPFFQTRIFSDLPPQRGDVIVFEYPDPDMSHEREDFIKRVVAVPGDILEAEGGHPIINGWRVPNCAVGEYRNFDNGNLSNGQLFVEYLGDTAYLAVYEDGGDRHGRQGPYVVKPGEVWVMGDNRHNSSDSRAWRGGEGAGVPYEQIKGRAMFVWWPPDGMFSRVFLNVMGEPKLPPMANAELTASVQRCLAKRPSVADATPPAAKPK